jgi:hypothetical protein
VSQRGDAVAGHVIGDIGAYYSVDDNPVIVATYEPAKPGNNAYYDADESLVRQNNRDLCSKLIVNVYPGWVRPWGLNLGLTLSVQKGAVFLGLASGEWPVGLTASTLQEAKYMDDT